MNIETNSKNIKNGDTFIALKGYKTDGHKYIEEAINNGASKIICEYGNYDIPTLIVKDTNIYLKEYLKNNYNFDDLCIIGVTGTNGKTTTAYLISSMLTNLKIDNAYIGTIGFYINNQKIKDLNNTTPDTLTFYKLLKEIKEKNIKYVITEVSSHSLDMDRLYGINLDIGIFTNLTEDHLDYHKNMDDYLKAKLKIINKLKENGTLIVNNDDDYSKYFDFKNKITIGFNNSDYIIKDYKNIDDGTIIYLNDYKIKTNLKGKFNIYNYIEALICLKYLNFDIKDIIKINNKLTEPPGRMETIKYKNNYIIVDYAHTPDAVEKIIKAVKEIYDNKIITIIGCGGNRDKTKREIMGLISTTLSDYVIFTNDNPRDEDPDIILNDITINLKKNNYEIIKDRKEAIFKGLDMLDNNILLILGKGHEDYQIIKGIKYHFSDKEIVLDYIKKNP